MNKKEDGMLYVVPTPVGNLNDITIRTIEVLKNVDVVYAEDTRTTSILFKKHDIKVNLKSYHSFNEHKITASIVEEIQSGKNIALVSDAGTPGISDPGFFLIRALKEVNVQISCLPGPTAFVPALVMSGLTSDKFYFEGFLPHKKGRQTRLKFISELAYTFILYESPFRLEKCISELLTHCGADRKACIVREISKIHEQAVTDTLANLSLKLEDKTIPAKGEIVIVVEGKIS